MKSPDNKPATLAWIALTCLPSAEKATKEILHENGVVLNEHEIPASSIRIGEDVMEGTLFEGICPSVNIQNLAQELSNSPGMPSKKGVRGALITKPVFELPEHTLQQHNYLKSNLEIKFSKS